MVMNTPLDTNRYCATMDARLYLVRIFLFDGLLHVCFPSNIEGNGVPGVDQEQHPASATKIPEEYCGNQSDSR